MFTEEVIEQLKYYVYRLVDPRNNQTFYVGKGKGNRVFAHVAASIKNWKGKSYLEKDEDDISAKIQQIREIKASGKEVIHVIHRYGLSEKEAFEVEAALIDVYEDLTNLHSGHGSERGMSNADEIQRELSYETYKEDNSKYVIIKINKKSLKAHNNDIYETVRGAWKVDVKKASNYKLCFAVLNGIVVNVYNIKKWYASTQKGRYEFTGNEADINIKNNFVNKRIPPKYRKKGVANPILYHG